VVKEFCPEAKESATSAKVIDALETDRFEIERQQKMGSRTPCPHNAYTQSYHHPFRETADN
jgi:hypothetical protein